MSLVGHAHPAIVRAVTERVARGTHFAQPTEDALVVATELARRFGLPLWRFGNSGTEATMDAVHLMRAATGRDLVIKVEGCYHGHHDSVEVSVLPEADEAGPPERPVSVPGNTGIPQAFVDLVAVVGFNDVGRGGPGARREPRPGRGDDRRAGDDERRHHPARRRLPRRGPRPAARPRRAARLRRGEDRAHRLPRRRHRGVRRHPRHHLPRQGAGRRAAGGRHRRHRGGDGADRRRDLRAGGDVQRQPAVDGRRPRHAARGADARGLCPGRAAPGPAARAGDRGAADPRPARGTS